MASYTLHIQYVDRPAETRTITQHKLTIGRDAGDIVLHDSQVSGRHAEIDWDGTTLKFVDLGSTNGSFLLQGQRVANLELTPGIALRVGNSLITVQNIEGVASSAGKGRTVIAGPGMVPGFPAPAKPGAPVRPPGSGMPAPPAGAFAFAPTAQHQGPLLRPAAPQPGGPAGAPGGLPFTGAPPMHGAPSPFPAPTPAAAPSPFPAPMPAAAPSPFPAPTPAAAPSPFPTPQPPGPAPGAFGGPTPQSNTPMPPSSQPMAAPQPLLAQPMPAPGLVPEVVTAPGPLAQQQPGEPAAGPAGEDLVAQIKQILGAGWKVLEPVAAPAIATVAAVLIPIGLLGQLGLMILPLSIAGLLATLLALVQLAALVILIPSLGRFVLGSYLGQPVPIQAAVQQQVNKAADVAVNCFVPGIVFGIFAAPIYFVEDKKLGAVIGRNFNLLAKELVPIVAAALAGAVVVGLGSAIVSYILLLLPLGGILNSVFVNGVTAFMVAFAAALGVSQYFVIRRKHEGGDPEGEARARLGAAAGVLPSA